MPLIIRYLPENPDEPGTATLFVTSESPEEKKVVRLVYRYLKELFKEHTGVELVDKAEENQK